MNIYNNLPGYATAVCIAAALTTGCVKSPGNAGENEDKGQYTLALTPDKIENVSYEGYSYDIAVASNSVWEIDHYPDWCALYPDWGDGDGFFKLKVTGNNEEQPRQGIISVTAGDVTKVFGIYQEANPDSRPDLFLSIGDPAFLAALKSVYPSIDLNGDGRLTEDEAAEVRYLTITNAHDITSLSGIGQFVNLEGFTCTATKLETVELSGMKALKNLMLSETPTLKNLDLAGCVSLENLSLNHTSLSSFPLAEFENLRLLECRGTNITELDISGCRSLALLDCRECPELTTVYVWWDPEEYPGGPDGMILQIDETTNIVQKESIL